jgi:hypothetical protein
MISKVKVDLKAGVRTDRLQRSLGIQSPLKVAHFILRTIAIPPILFLKLASEIRAVTCRHIEHVICEFAPLGLRLSLQLFPIASNYVFVHFFHPGARFVPQYGALQPVASK